MLTIQMADFDRALLDDERTLLLTCISPPVGPRKKQTNRSLLSVVIQVLEKLQMTLVKSVGHMWTYLLLSLLDE